jgi:hypothetical protein
MEFRPARSVIYDLPLLKKQAKRNIPGTDPAAVQPAAQAGEDDSVIVSGVRGLAQCLISALLRKSPPGQILSVLSRCR